MMIASAKAPAQPLCAWSGWMMSANTKMPITIDGTPFSTSSDRRTTRATLAWANSLT